jgi:hypothetical protein
VFIYSLRLDYYTHYAEQVEAVTNAQTLAMAKKYLGQERLIVVAGGRSGEDRAADQEAEPGQHRSREGRCEAGDGDAVARGGRRGTRLRENASDSI